MIVKWSEGIARENMDEEILVHLAPLIRRHPWWQARTKLLLALLQRLGILPPARIFDAGCGWGITLEALEKYGYQAVGSDISRRTLEQLDRANRCLIEADLMQPLDRSERFNAVLALDVIEHLDNDRAAIAHLAELVQPGGVAILSVPALPEMYSEFDRIQGHRRRYSPETLRAAFAKSGLQVESVFWWGQWLVPVLKRQRHHPCARAGESPAETYRRYLHLPPWPVPWIFRLAFALEQKRSLAGQLRIGTSLFAVARR